ncbi:transcription termination factor Rho [Patescibacteria group bacterium]|nr:transcription termination factor Rho [Patescibacteria group bacterium]
MPIKKKKEDSQDQEKKNKKLDSSKKTQDTVGDSVSKEEELPEVSETKEDPIIEDSVEEKTSESSPRGSYSDRSGGYKGSQRSNYGGGYNYSGNTIKISGILEVLTDYGVIRQEQDNGDELPKDVYISHSQIKRFSLRMGDTITGLARPPKENERYLSLLKIETVGGEDPEKAKKRPVFTKLTPIFPDEWMQLETKPEVIATRLIDLISPIGKGQRAMLVAPPKAGKTFLLLDIANGITTNYPETTLLVALIGERPEEVTHFARSVKGEVFASNFDEKAEEQTRISELCLEKAKRLAEIGKDVVILMDSITRLARAYNMVAPPSGRTLTGGFDPAALYPAKHFFGAARNLEGSGSLTIIATALVDTGSRMDDVIFEEFKGTGNMELRLDRSLAERRIFPSIDIKSSGTRHEEDLISADMLEKVFRLRRMVDLLDDREATPLVIDQLKKTKSNKEFLDTLNKGGA